MQVAVCISPRGTTKAGLLARVKDGLEGYGEDERQKGITKI